MLAYLDPGPPPDSAGGIGLLEVALVVLLLVALGVTIYVAVRLADRKRD